MNIAGEFHSPAPPGELRTLSTDTGRLAKVPVLSDLQVSGDVVRARFTPSSLFAGTCFDVVIRPDALGAESARLSVSGRHGPHLVDVALAIGFAPAEAGSLVSWSADVTVRGPLASVGQRVVRDLAARAIGEVLEHAAGVVHA